MRSSVAVLAAALCVVLAAPAAARSATKTVSMGLPPAEQKLFNEQHGSDANEFFPSEVIVNTGDAVRFRPVGFHSVEFPVKGRPPRDLFVSSAKRTAGVMDAAGQQFWFNGQPEFGINLEIATGSLGRTVAYTGAARVATGLPFTARPRPMTVRFPRPGTFSYYCNIHPGMKGRVTVRSAARPAPSADSDARRMRRQVARGLAIARRLKATSPPPGTIYVGSAGRNGVEFYDFFPKAQTVPVGTVLTFQSSARSHEAHTATTGPGDPDRPDSYLGRLAASFQRAVYDSQAVYPSELPPAPPAALTPALHGNGFWNSGLLDAIGPTPLPDRKAVRFAAPGTYTFICLLHTFMSTTITVSGQG
jgi:plastocyanin